MMHTTHWIVHLSRGIHRIPRELKCYMHTGLPCVMVYCSHVPYHIYAPCMDMRELFPLQCMTEFVVTCAPKPPCSVIASGRGAVAVVVHFT